MIKKTFLISTIAILILTAFVLAAGSSTGSDDSDDDSSTIRDKVKDYTVTLCEDKETVRDRIKCRIENKEEIRKYAYDVVEEACRDDRFKEKCEKLYERARHCYQDNNSTNITITNSSLRKKCFLEESGININSKGTFRAAPTEAKRNYVVLLLYELQERIERLQENGKITTEQATSLIEKIIEIKKMILAGNSRSEIIVKINEFKSEYRSVMRSIK